MLATDCSKWSPSSLGLTKSKQDSSFSSHVMAITSDHSWPFFVSSALIFCLTSSPSALTLTPSSLPAQNIAGRLTLILLLSIASPVLNLPGDVMLVFLLSFPKYGSVIRKTREYEVWKEFPGYSYIHQRTYTGNSLYLEGPLFWLKFWSVDIQFFLIQLDLHIFPLNLCLHFICLNQKQQHTMWFTGVHTCMCMWTIYIWEKIGV